MRAWAPLAQSWGVEYSAMAWLMPLTLGTNSMAIGAIEATA